MMALVQGAGVAALLAFYEYPLWVAAIPVVLAVLYPTICTFVDRQFFGSVQPAARRGPSVSATATAAAKKKLSDEEDKKKPPVTIIYASQTGNAQSYAENMAREAKKLGFKVTLTDVADYDKDMMWADKFLVFVVSTYGEGEPTDTSKDFYEWLLCEDRMHDMNDFKDVSFATFGLGDSQYKHFCQMGVEFDQRTAELGGKRIHTLGTGDADCNMEEEFDQWKQDLWVKATKQFGLEARDEFADAPEQQLKTKRHPPPKEMPSPFTVTSSNLPPTQKLPCWGVITRHEELLKSADGRSTLHIEIDCTHTALQNYEAGDHLGILPANDADLVQEYMRLLSITPEDDKEIISLVSAEGLSQRNHLPSKVNVQTALTWYFDLQGVPKKSVLRSFSHFTENKQEQEAFRDLLRINEESTKKYHVAVKKARTIAGFLQMFPSTKVPLDLFYEMMPRTQPRWYSIASDSLFHGKHVHMCLAVSDGGLCSAFMKDKTVGAKVPCFLRKSTFHLPSRDKKRPMVMIGPGTGVAPMVGFLYRKLKWQETGHELGSCRFYFGCRKQSEDYIYEDLMERCKEKGVISALRVAFSRDQAEKVYVQNLVAQDAKEIWEVVEAGGNIYICGDAKNMAKQVEDELVKILVNEGGMSKQAAEDKLNKMEKSQKYLKDVWTSH